MKEFRIIKRLFGFHFEEDFDIQSKTGPFYNKVKSLLNVTHPDRQFQLIKGPIATELYCLQTLEFKISLANNNLIYEDSCDEKMFVENSVKLVNILNGVSEDVSPTKIGYIIYFNTINIKNDPSMDAENVQFLTKTRMANFRKKIDQNNCNINIQLVCHVDKHTDGYVDLNLNKVINPHVPEIDITDIYSLLLTYYNECFQTDFINER